jgi:hypothetical protein
MDAGINNVIYMELYSGPKMANGTCGKTIVTGTIDRGSTVLPTWTSLQCLSSQAMQEQNGVNNFTAEPSSALLHYKPDNTTISYTACTAGRYTKYLYGNYWWPPKFFFMVFPPVKESLKFNMTCTDFLISLSAYPLILPTQRNTKSWASFLYVGHWHTCHTRTAWCKCTQPKFFVTLFFSIIFCISSLVSSSYTSLAESILNWQTTGHANEANLSNLCVINFSLRIMWQFFKCHQLTDVWHQQSQVIQYDKIFRSSQLHSADGQFVTDNL